MSKNILILGAGGHGTISLQKLFELSECNFDIVFHTADWGGSQGLWGRLLKIGDYFLDNQLNKESGSFLPFGDPNKLINFYFLQAFPGQQFFDFRSSEFLEIKEKTLKFLENINVNEDFKKEFLEYLNISFEFYAANKKKINFKREFCVGYVFHSYILKKTGNLEEWNKYFHQIGILPKNIRINFASEERTVMIGHDISLVKLVGEDKIDHHNNPILPETVYLSSIRNKKPIKEIKNLLENIRKSECIIIPSGSITNWISILNLEGVCEELRNKKVVWLTNPYSSRNELTNIDYLRYLKERKVNTIIVKSRKDPKLPGQYILGLNKRGRYESEELSTVLKKIIFE
jgi:hypothetical protein